jgi:hypothetical protein
LGGTEVRQCFAWLAPVSALVVVAGAAPARADDPDFIALSVGYYDILHNEEPAGEARIEYRSDKKLWIFKPFVGLMGTTDGVVHAYAGILVDIFLGRRLVLTPSFAPGLYHEGDGKDLGHVVEFRSQIELAYRFDDRSRLGISFNHISNASIGDHNPGVETLAITYAIPTSRLFGR